MALDPAAMTPSEVRGPKFTIITKELSGGTDPDSGRRRFKATASSTIVDHKGDEIQLVALEKLAHQFRRGVGVFMDHDRSTGSAFGVTDGAEIVQRGMDDSGVPVWDLDVTGIVNTPNPRAAQLADSIDGGYVKLGASVTAWVRKHQKKANGAMLISELDAIEVSIVGVPENQRSWAQKAALAVKSFKGFGPDSSQQEEQPVDETESAAEATEATPGSDTGEAAAPAAEATTETATTASTETVSEAADNGTNPTDESSVDAGSAPSVQESAQETPETAPGDDSADKSADPPSVEKAFDPGEVRELVGQVTALVTEIGRLREEIVQKDAKIATYETEAGALSTEVDQARQVITKVLGMPLRPQTAGYVESFATDHSLFAPEVAEYLSKRSKLTP